MNVDGKTVLITGSTDGVGRYVARRLAASGAKVLIHGRDAARAKQLADEVKREGHAEPVFYQADLSSLDGARRLAQSVLAENDRLDIFISNAGIGSQTQGTNAGPARMAMNCGSRSTICLAFCWRTCCFPC